MRLAITTLAIVFTSCVSLRSSSVRSANGCTPSEQIDAAVVRPAQDADGVFVDLDGKFRWRKFFATHRVKSVVIQNIVGYSSTGKLYDKTEEAIALINEVPDDVEHIYVGLVYDERFNSASVALEKLSAAADEDWKLAHAFWDRLSDEQQDRVTGWYLGRELHNLRANTERKAALKKYLHTVSTKLPDRDYVLISPYFVPPVPARPDVLPAKETADLFRYLIDGSNVNVLLLQDGVGARNDAKKKLGCKWSVDAYLPVSAHFARTIIAQLPYNVEFWSNVEAFGVDVSPARVRRQIGITPDKHPVYIFAYRQCATQRACVKR